MDGQSNTKVQLYLYSPSGPSWSAKGWTLPLWRLYRSGYFFHWNL